MIGWTTNKHVNGESKLKLKVPLPLWSTLDLDISALDSRSESIQNMSVYLEILWWIEIKGIRERESKTQRWGGEPGLKKKFPVRTPLTNTKQLFLLLFGDLPCKRTCHGKGRMTKMLNQNSSLIHQAISSLTNISYIHHTHYQFTYLNPLPSSPIPPLGDSSSPHQAAKHITDPTNLACRDHDARSDLRIINK